MQFSGEELNRRRQFDRTKSEAGKDRKIEVDEDLEDFFQDDVKIDEDLDFQLSDNKSNSCNRFEANDRGTKSNDFGLESEMFEDDFDYDDESLIHEVTTNKHEITTNQSKITTTQGAITSKQNEITMKQDSITTNQDEICTNRDEVTANQNEITKKLDGQVNPRFEGKFNFDQTLFYKSFYVRQSLECINIISAHSALYCILIEQALSICNVLILSNFNYFPLIWLFCNKGANKKTDRAHKRAPKILHKDFDSSFLSLLARSNSFTIHEKKFKN